MSKKNVQFTHYDNTNDRINELIEYMKIRYDVDFHEWEKNLFALAYDLGYKDCQVHYNKSK